MAPPDRAETVRPGRPADRAALTRIQEALTEPSPALLSAALDATGTDGPLVVLVRVTGGDPVGYTVAVAGPSVYVPELAVDPAHHREGHGSALVAALRERFDARELRLTVAVTDDRARAFYRSQGFERVDKLPDHFESGDALVLVLSR